MSPRAAPISCSEGMTSPASRVPVIRAADTARLRPRRSGQPRRRTSCTGVRPLLEPCDARPAGVAPQANRPRQPSCRRFTGEAVHGLRCRHQPRGQSLHRARPAVEPQQAQRPVQHASLATSKRPRAPCLARRARRLVSRLRARPAHPAADLTVHHVVPLAAGGGPFDIANTAVLCRSCNSTKGASTDRGGVAHMGPRLNADPHKMYGEHAGSLPSVVHLTVGRSPA